MFCGRTGFKPLAALLVICSSRTSALLVSPDHLYQGWLASAPITTKAVTSSVLYAAGDALAQKRQMRRRSQSSSGYDDERTINDEPLCSKRLARMAGTGFGSGVLWHYYYGFADVLLAPLGDPTSRIACAMALEQFAWCPILFSLYVIPLSALLNGARPRELGPQVKANLGSLLLANAKVWTPANVVIYAAPVEYRVLASNCIDIVWACVCSDEVADCGNEECDPAVQPDAVQLEAVVDGRPLARQDA